MAADEEFRRVAEDVRELARALRSELRAAKWEAKDAARQARREWRAYYRSGGWHDHRQGGGWWMPPAAGGPGTAYPGTGPLGAPPGAAGGPGPAGGPGGPAGAGPGATTSPGAPADAGSGGVPAPGAGPATGAPPRPAGPPYDPYRRPPWAKKGWSTPPGGWGQWAGQMIPRPPVAWQPPRPPARPPKPEKPQKPPRPKNPPVRHRRDGSTLISLLLVVVGLAWLGSESGVLSVSLEAVLAAVLALLGAVMVVTARTDWSLSRRHWPVWLGLSLLLVLLISVNGPAVRGSFSSFHMGPVSATPGWKTASYADFAGPLELDLTTLSPGPGDVTIRAHDVFGPVTVRVPPNPGFRIAVDARTSFGPVQIGSARPSAGMFTHQTAMIGSGGPIVHLDVSDAFGPVTVHS